MPLTENMKDYYLSRTKKHIYVVNLIGKILLHSGRLTEDFDNK